MAVNKSLKLIKNAEVYAPKYIEKKDVLIAADIIGCVQENIELKTNFEIETINAKGKILIPGLIDSHVHIIGGGGEGSFKTRTPEIMLSDIIKAGVTTVVGCLGTDGTTRTMSNLIAKARGLEEEGITCYVYTGSYQVPVKTLLGSIQEDIIFIDKIIGVGEIALSDHRSSQPTIEELTKIASAARRGGMLSGKAGIVNIHMGDGNRKLKLLEEIIETTEIPATQFIPTHAGRNVGLFEASVRYAKNGGLIDFTTSNVRDFGDNKGEHCSELLAMALEQGVPAENISFSSDGQGSLPVFNERGECIGLKVGEVASLFEEARNAIIKKKIPIEVVLQVVTSNPARNLKLNNKGCIQAGKDADIVLLDKDLEIDTVIAQGRVLLKNKEVMVKGTFEK
ncbi:beta-aspartyl-peptidase [candidate division KSB1 bacterium]|nr:beta-aspartyl-peptidase [candidate division KSB1 bacterium]MBL7092719.1 beta-aspartyl-peptidase [candidate division KSB1 bacterium]